MKTGSVGFIGGGRIARIFIQGWDRAKALPEPLVVADPSRVARDQLEAGCHRVEVSEGLGPAANQDIVFLATHPPIVPEVARQLGSLLKPSAILVSLAPKFTIAQLGKLLGGFSRIARVNPNAPSIVGAGFNPIAFGAALAADDRRRLTELLAPLGANPEVAEELLEAYAVFTAMGPTYLWYQLQALRELAISFGLTETQANAGLDQMVSGTVRTLLQARLSADEVMDLVPVKPLAELESQVLTIYRSRLPAMLQKIKPAP